MLKRIFLLCMVAFFVGCATYKTGVEISQEVLDSIKVNQSTREDVEKRLGYPSRKSEISGVEIWYYDFTKIGDIFDTNVDESTVVEFNKSGKVIKKYKTQGSGNKIPLLR